MDFEKFIDGVFWVMDFVNGTPQGTNDIYLHTENSAAIAKKMLYLEQIYYLKQRR